MTGWPAGLGMKVSAGVLCILAAPLFLAGCTTAAKHPRAVPVAQTQPASSAHACCSQNTAKASSTEEAINILRAALARCDALDGYEIIFHRQERRGLLSQLSDWEYLKVHYRKQPVAIKMTWLDPQSEYQECVYVEGTNDGRVAVLPRKGLFGLPAAPLSVPPETAVALGKSLRPITEFGLASMIRQTLHRLEQAKEAGGANVTYEGVAVVEKVSTRAHHVTIAYPKGFGRSARQDLYIDVDTGYPVGSYQWLPNGELLAAYLYEKPSPGKLADEVFAITAARTLAAARN